MEREQDHITSEQYYILFKILEQQIFILQLRTCGRLKQWVKSVNCSCKNGTWGMITAFL